MERISTCVQYGGGCRIAKAERRRKLGIFHSIGSIKAAAKWTRRTTPKHNYDRRCLSIRCLPCLRKKKRKQIEMIIFINVSWVPRRNTNRSQKQSARRRTGPIGSKTGRKKSWPKSKHLVANMTSRAGRNCEMLTTNWDFCRAFEWLIF